MPLRTVSAIRYVSPFREGGSLPALCEADDDGLYVVKFRGAGQGRRALVAEVVAGELARALGFDVPELVTVGLDEAFGRAEPDPEIQELLTRSAGVNLGVDFLPGAVTFAPASGDPVAADLAAEIVWLDALVMNVDRTAHNTNLLLWHSRLYLIDHGASLYFHHDDRRPAGFERTSFPQVAHHVLLPYAGSIERADERLSARVDDGLLERVVDLVPDALLNGDDRVLYHDYLTARLEAPRAFVEEAERARAA